MSWNWDFFEGYCTCMFVYIVVSPLRQRYLPLGKKL